MSAASTGHELIQVVTLLGAAVALVPLFRWAKLGSVLGYLFAGLVIGPFGLKFFSDSQAILHIAELGVVMFLFVIGLEMRPAPLVEPQKVAIALNPEAASLVTEGDTK